MRFGKVQKTILVLEVVAILGGGGVLAFVPEQPTRPPRIGAAAIAHDTSGMVAEPVEMLSAEERANLENILKVDINTASVEELMNIPRFGPSTAQAVIAYRDQHGPFKSFADLDAIPRIGPSLIAILPKYARLSGVDTAAASAPGVSMDQGIDLNTATPEQLQTVPGVGPSMAERIIAARPFRSVEDLLNVPGIGPAKFESWKTHFRVSGSAAARGTGGVASTSSSNATGGKINLNTATAEELQKIPGVGPSMAQAIIEYRNKNGRFQKLEDVDNVPRVGPAMIERMRPLVFVQ